jgi:hypothetical protein
MLLVSLLNIYVLSTVLLLTLLLSDSDGPAAVDIHDFPIVLAAAVISDVNNVPAVVGLPARCCFTTFASIPTFASFPSALAVHLLLSSLLLPVFLLLLLSLLILASLF